MQKCFGLLPEDINFVAPNGEVSEWSIEHAWKACVLQGTAGSNPALSANINYNPLIIQWVFLFYKLKGND